MLVIAHRGANREAVENSWAAFELAIACGATRIEFDLQLSRDGHPVVMHDDSLRRTTGYPGSISKMDRAEIVRLRLTNGESIPMFDEVIERLAPRVELNIEIKGAGPKLAEKVCEIIGQHRSREKFIVSCFHVEPLQWIRDHCDTIQRACLLAKDHWNWPQFASHSPLNFLSMAGAKILHPEVDMVDENFMDQAVSRGVKVYTWASMQGEEADREGLWTVLKTFGVHGHCSNYPRQLVRWLSEVNQDEHKFKASSAQ